MFRHESKFQLYRPPAFSFWIGPHGLVCRWKVQLSFSRKCLSVFASDARYGVSCAFSIKWHLWKRKSSALNACTLGDWREETAYVFHILSLCTVLAQHIPIPRSIRKPFYHKGWGLQRTSSWRHCCKLSQLSPVEPSWALFFHLVLYVKVIKFLLTWWSSNTGDGPIDAHLHLASTLPTINSLVSSHV